MILNGSSGIFMFVHSVLLNEVVVQELRIRLRIDSKATRCSGIRITVNKTATRCSGIRITVNKFCSKRCGSSAGSGLALFYSNFLPKPWYKIGKYFLHNLINLEGTGAMSCNEQFSFFMKKRTNSGHTQFCVSGMFIRIFPPRMPYAGSRIQDPRSGSATKNLRIFNPKHTNTDTKLWEI